MPKPKRPRWDVPAVKPDLDKLTRAVFDALTDAGVWRDDSRVVDMRVTKRYEDAEAVPGVWVEVQALKQCDLLHPVSGYT
nr:MAG TPA: Endodeoxyribonuclease RusA [Caudoviricetes sp.]